MEPIRVKSLRNKPAKAVEYSPGPLKRSDTKGRFCRIFVSFVESLIYSGYFPVSEWSCMKSFLCVSKAFFVKPS